MSEELRPCPFCGGKAKLNYERIPGENKGFWAQIICCNCHGRSGGTWAGSYNAAERKEVKTWNRRENDKIDSRSTTYDVDKVVEELEEIICPKRLYFCRVSKGRCNKSDDVGCIDCAIQKAIEIVKRGGKNE